MDAGLRMRHQVFSCLVTIWLVAVCAAQAQPPLTPETVPGGDPLPPREVVIESNIKILWLQSPSGELVPAADLTVAEYNKLILLRDNYISPNLVPTDFSFNDDIGFTGTANEVEARFKVTMNIRVRDNSDGESPSWIRIPLRLNQTILMPGAKHVGNGEFFVTYEKQGDGYVAWLRAAPNSSHLITLNIKLPVVRVGGKLRVSLLAPHQATQFKLEVPGTDLEVTTGNLVESILTTKKVDNQKTSISVENIGGRIEIAWREKNRTDPVLESTGTTLATINGQKIDYEINLRVHSFGAPIRTFDVRLPAFATWIPEPSPGVNVELVSKAGSKTGLLRVTRQDGKEQQLLEVRLRAFIPPVKVLAGQTEVSGFEVIGAKRQTGSLDLAVVGNWTVDWFPGSYVRQVQVSESQRQNGVVARFEYDTQPFSLKVEVRKVESQIRVVPAYSLFVEETQLRLIGNLKYTASSARFRKLLIQADGWIIDRVLPADLIAETISLTENSPLTIPLVRNGKPIAEEFEIRIEMHWPISTNGRSFNVKLPRPVNVVASPASLSVFPADSVNVVASPATLAVFPADNIDLTLRSEEIKGLIAESLPPDLDDSKTGQPPLYYVEEPSDTGAVFAGDFEVRSRIVAANVANTMTFADRSLAIEHRFELDISYEPLRQIKFNIPEAAAPIDQIQFFELISEADATANGGLRERPLAVLDFMPADDQGIAEVTVDLLEDRIKTCSIVARYSLPITPGATGDSLPLKLIRVSVDPSITIGTSNLRLVATEEVEVELVSSGWDTLIDDLLDPSSRDQLFQISGGVDEVEIIVRLVKTPQLGATVLEKFWLQSYLSRSMRQDRACFQLRTNSERIQVQLPTGASLLGVAVQGLKHQTAEASNTGLVAIDLDPAESANTYTVEVWYWFSALDVPVARLTVEPPTLVGVQHARRIYWQLVLPRDEHLLIPPSTLTAEYVWRWNFNHWGRHSTRRQTDLEAIMNATRWESPPDQSINQYLFTSVGPIPPVEFITASRGALTLVLSLTVLVGGLCLIYFRWARHPASLLVGGVLVMSLGFAFPEPTILGAQAATMGIVFVLLARLLHGNASRRRAPAIATSGSSISMVDATDGLVTQGAPEANSHTTTTIAPAAYQVPIAESKS
jgi:hypothetical protein